MAHHDGAGSPDVKQQNFFSTGSHEANMSAPVHNLRELQEEAKSKKERCLHCLDKLFFCFNWVQQHLGGHYIWTEEDFEAAKKDAKGLRSKALKSSPPGGMEWDLVYTAGDIIIITERPTTGPWRGYIEDEGPSSDGNIDGDKVQVGAYYNRSRSIRSFRKGSLYVSSSPRRETAAGR